MKEEVEVFDCPTCNSKVTESEISDTPLYECFQCEAKVCDNCAYGIDCEFPMCKSCWNKFMLEKYKKSLWTEGAKKKLGFD
jgi:hypothetical protein